MKIGILGYGNVGKTFAAGLVKSGFADLGEIYVYNRGAERCAEALLTGLNVCMTPAELFEKADLIFIAVKGFAFDEICAENDRGALLGKSVVSFMAGMTTAEIKQRLGVECEVIRIMPTLAMADLMGVSGAVKNNNEYIKRMFSSMGFYFEVEETDIEKVTAYSGCGLGFAAYLLNAYVKAGEALGFDGKTSEEITRLTFAGALKSGNYEQTVKKVATKGGATEQGVSFMNERNVEDLICGAVKSAYDKYGR